MELVDELRGLRICIDTAPFIYFIEKHPKYLNVVRPIFIEIDAGEIEAITSTIIIARGVGSPIENKKRYVGRKIS